DDSVRDDMHHKLRDRSTEMTLAKRNQPIQTFFFDRPDKAFRIGVRIRRPIRRPDDTEPSVLQACADRLTPLRIPIAISTRHTSPSAIVRVRTTWPMNASSGCGVDARTWTRREASSMANTV